MTFCFNMGKLSVIFFTALSINFAHPSPTFSGSAGFIRNFPPSPLALYNDGKIIGGEDAGVGEFPFQVSIQVKPIFGDKYHNCGGTILDPTHIITAAHCVEGQILNQVSILAGAHNMKIGEVNQQLRVPKRLIWHDDFDNELNYYDAAVITVTVPFTFNEWVQPLPLAPEGYDHSGVCWNTGWGNANPTGGTPIMIPDALQKIPLEIVPRANCSEAFNGINPVDETMVCARGLDDDSYQGSCNGDSGGPLICLNSNNATYLAGIVSWGMNPCGQYHYPTVFGDVANKGIRDFLVLEGARP